MEARTEGKKVKDRSNGRSSRGKANVSTYRCLPAGQRAIEDTADQMIEGHIPHTAHVEGTEGRFSCAYYANTFENFSQAEGLWRSW